jgi:hypothetical protein
VVSLIVTLNKESKTFFEIPLKANLPRLLARRG